MKPFVAPPPPGAQPPPLWGDLAHVRELLGDRVTDLQRRASSCCASTSLADPVAFRDYFKTNYGPTIAAYRGLARRPRAHRRARPGPGRPRRAVPYAGRRDLDWEYLLVVATVV